MESIQDPRKNILQQLLRKQKVLTDKLEEHLKCSKCNKVKDIKLNTKCAHGLCKECLSELDLEFDDGKYCPNCLEEFVPSEVSQGLSELMTCHLRIYEFLLSLKTDICNLNLMLKKTDA